MRIVGGALKGRQIIAPRGDTTRPTSDRAREGIFNILTHGAFAPPLEGAIVADIFAGSGALGLEALSRGAQFCLFVETAPAARAAIRENIDQLGLAGRTRVHRRDALRLRIEPANLRGVFTHIFVDPPYEKNMALPVLRKLSAQKLIDARTVIIYEMAKEEEPNLSRFTIHDDRIWGAARAVFMTPP